MQEVEQTEEVEELPQIQDEEIPQVDTEVIKSKIQSIIRNIKHKSQISIGGEAKDLPTMPGLSIKGYGQVALPLTEANAKDLIKLCKQAPYGRNRETLVDKEVRDTYQLDPASVKIENPTWNKQLKELTKHVAKELLGCANANVTAKLYKMLIYEKGGHFKKHRDTEKEKGEKIKF